VAVGHGPPRGGGRGLHARDRAEADIYRFRAGLQEDADARIADLLKSFELDPDHYSIVGDLERAFENKHGGDAAALADAWTKVVDLAPGKVEPHAKRGEAFLDAGKCAEAIQDFTFAILEDPGDAEHYDNRGIARRLTGDFKGAMADHNRALEIDPEREWAYIHRGEVLVEKGDLDAAIADCTRAIELDEDIAASWEFRAFLRYEKGDFAGAIADWERAIRVMKEWSEEMFRERIAAAKEGIERARKKKEGK
jgi:tetratricopeptide (TPR) repeat protein